MTYLPTSFDGLLKAWTDLLKLVYFLQMFSRLRCEGLSPMRQY